MIKSEILNKIFESGASTTKSITVFGVIFGALVLAYAVYSNLPDVGYMFAVFMITTCGLTTTKGLVDIAKAKIGTPKAENEFDGTNGNGYQPIKTDVQAKSPPKNPNEPVSRPVPPIPPSPVVSRDGFTNPPPIPMPEQTKPQSVKSIGW